MESLPCQGCRGLCCGPVPVTEQELKRIRKIINTMPAKKRQELKNQDRFFGTCIFYDVNNDQCGIYSVRPKICRDFGYYKKLVCFRKPELATLDKWSNADRPVAILSSDITWNDFK